MIVKREFLWGVKVTMEDGPTLFGAAGTDQAVHVARLFRYRREAREWASQQGTYFKREYRPTAVRVRVTVEG